MHRRTFIGGTCLVVFGWLPGPVIATPVTSPDSGALPVAPAPFGIADASLPSGWDSVRAVFAALPPSIAGSPAQPTQVAGDRLVATYGADTPLGVPALSIMALSFADGDFFPADFNAGAFVTMAGVAPDIQATGFGRDGDIAWISTATSIGFDGDKPGTPLTVTALHTLSWGAVDGGWLYSVSSPVEANLAILAAAFIDAAQATAST